MELYKRLKEYPSAPTPLDGVTDGADSPGGNGHSHSFNKEDLLLQGLGVLGEAYSMGLNKLQFRKELDCLETEAKQDAKSSGQTKSRDRVLLDRRNEFLEVDGIMRKYDFQQDSLIKILMDVQARYNLLPRHILNWISNRLSIPLSETYELATFYEAFTLEPRGRHTIRVCNGTACHVRGAEKLQKRFEDILGIPSGQTDRGREFTLESVNCPGCCALAPAVQIGSQFYNNPSEDEIREIITSLEKEEE